MGEAFFAAATAGRKGTRYHLIAERLPEEHDGWDWTVWSPETALHGHAHSAEATLRAAETAVWHWDETAASATPAVC